MQPYKYVPELCKDKKSGFTGHVVLKPRSMPEKYRLLSQCDLKLDENGVPLEGVANLEAIANAVELSEKYWKEVAIKKGDKTYKSFKDLVYDNDCEGIVSEVAFHVVGNSTLGES